MTLKEYLFGRRIVLRSPHRKDWVIDQIRRSVGSPLSFSHHGVSGVVYFGRLRLAWKIPFFRNDFRPVLRGHFVDKGRDTELHVVFGATTFLRVFFVFWYMASLSILVFGLHAMIKGGKAGDDPWIVITPLLFLVVNPAIHFLFNRKANRHWDAMLDLLEREAGLVPVDGAARAAG